jgi:hypothetical protein
MLQLCYYNFDFKFKNASGYWIVKNKDSAIFNLNYLNNKSSAESIFSFDFKKLYTNLPHDKVVEKISALLDKCFKRKELGFINVSAKYKASWSSTKKSTWSFSFDDIVSMFKFLMNNIYVKFRGMIYRQVVGIPMGCDCAPQVADLFLYWYEHSYIESGVQANNPVVHVLKFASRYIDDLNVPNINADICSIICNDIYPDELDILATNTDSKATTFLDLDIGISDSMFGTKLYDKRRDFSFKVVTFPNLRSNIPHKPSYGVFVGELYRICKSSSDARDFIKDVKLLICKLVSQKFDKNILYHNLKDFIKCRPACLSKHWHNFSVSEFM